VAVVAAVVLLMVARRFRENAGGRCEGVCGCTGSSSMQKLAILKGRDKSRSLQNVWVYGRETWSHMVTQFLWSPQIIHLKANGLIDC